MNMRRILILAGVLLILFLGMYSWNRRTRALDDLAASVGLEIGGAVLGSLRSIQDVGETFWERYFDLVDVREENLRLKERVDDLEARLLASGEDMAELRRLRELVQLEVDRSWRPLGARVLAGRLGPNAVLDSITINRGYATGGKPGTPLVTHRGLVGRVLRASPHAATALLITDPDSRVAVFGQESRAPGILMGRGLGRELEVNFVQRDAGVRNGEVLVTSGLDGKYPKGLPVARVSSVAPSDYTQFMAVSARPLVDLQHLEEVLLLERTGIAPPPEEPEGPPPVFVGPPLPSSLTTGRSQEARTRAEARETSQGVAGSGAAGEPAARPPAQRPAQTRVSGQAPGGGQPVPPRTQAGVQTGVRTGARTDAGAGAPAGTGSVTVGGTGTGAIPAASSGPASQGTTSRTVTPGPSAGGRAVAPPLPAARDGERGATGRAPRYRVVLP